jgi:hypothetical protein
MDIGFRNAYRPSRLIGTDDSVSSKQMDFSSDELGHLLSLDAYTSPEGAATEASGADNFKILIMRIMKSAKTHEDVFGTSN